jgi:hypothetical protein
MERLTHHWGHAIAATHLSQWLQNQLWIVPTSQSIHILMISVVFGCALLISLRLLGVSAGGRSVSTLVTTLVPWMYVALVMLLITGTVQTITEPMRQFVAPVFWLKMLLIVVVVPLTAVFAHTVRRNAARWDSAAARPAGARIFAAVSLALWIAIIVCGRFIAYTYESHL